LRQTRPARADPECACSRPRPRIVITRIPTGYPGTAITVRHMAALIRAGAKDFHVRQEAIGILVQRGVRPKDYLGEIKALFEWVQREVRYTKDPFRVEVLHSPRRMLELRAGDCDDMAILLGAMLEAVGHPVRLVLTGPDPLRPLLFSHVYLEANHRGSWIPLDATMPHPMGWAPRALVRMVVRIGRRPRMLPNGTYLQGLGAEAAPSWLPGLIEAVRYGGLRPRDERVRSLWRLLRERGRLGPWFKRVLRFAWNQGLRPSRHRPITTNKMVRRLQRLGLLPAGAALPVTATPVRPLQPVVVRPATPAGPAR